MGRDKILGITIPKESKEEILEKIIKYVRQPAEFVHIVSLNPENLVVAQENQVFKKVLNTAQIKIIDGVGIVAAAKILGVEAGRRWPGVEVVKELIKTASVRRLRLLFIGGRPNLAAGLSKCYQKKYPQAKFLGIEGIKNIKNPQKKEEKEIFSIVSRFKPHLVMVAFGSPDQELWLARHQERLKGVVGMGVGGAFDYLSGAVPYAPKFLRRNGLEWLFRLLVQPWRWRRQLRLIKFIWLVLKERCNKGLK